MQLKIYSVYDSKLPCYNQPIFIRSVGEALRMFTQAVQDPEHGYCKHAEDFTLFELGVWDDEAATITLHAAPVSIATALSLKSQVNALQSVA